MHTVNVFIKFCYSDTLRPYCLTAWLPTNLLPPCRRGGRGDVQCICSPNSKRAHTHTLCSVAHVTVNLFRPPTPTPLAWPSGCHRPCVVETGTVEFLVYTETNKKGHTNNFITQKVVQNNADSFIGWTVIQQIQQKNECVSIKLIYWSGGLSANNKMVTS